MKPGVGAPLRMEVAGNAHRGLLRAGRSAARTQNLNPISLFAVISRSSSPYRGDRELSHDWGYGCGKCPACELRKARLRKVSIVGMCATSGSLVPTFLRSVLLRAQLELLRRWVAAVPLSGRGSFAHKI